MMPPKKQPPRFKPFSNNKEENGAFFTPSPRFSTQNSNIPEHKETNETKQNDK